MSASPRFVLVTGGSSGIGQAICEKLAKDRFHVIGTCRGLSPGCLQSSGNRSSLQLNITDEASIGSAVRATTELVGENGLFAIVNNAGIAVGGPLEAVPIALARTQFEVNVIGTLAVTQAFLPLIRKARGRVVNVGSLNGKDRYRALFKAVLHRLAIAKDSGIDASGVAAVVSHVITCSNPKPRYFVGRDAVLGNLVARLMPPRVLDQILIRLFRS